MTPTPLLLRAFRRKHPHPPQHPPASTLLLRRLPSAGTPQPTPAGGRTILPMPPIPRRIPAPAPLAQRRARVRRLAQRRRLLLDRPQLHRRHRHRWGELRHAATLTLRLPLGAPLPHPLDDLAPIERRYLISLIGRLAASDAGEDERGRANLDRLRRLANP